MQKTLPDSIYFFLLLLASLIIQTNSAIGQAWQGFPVGPNNIVTTMATKAADVFVGGDFSKVTNAPNAAVPNSAYIAKWNGTTWSALGTGLNGSVTAMAVAPSGDLYVVGQFTMAGGIAAKGVARWDGTSWYAVGAGINGTISATNVARTLAFDASGHLYIGGSFSGVANVSGTRLLAYWNGTTWSSVGNAFGSLPGSPEVRSIYVDGSKVYVGGAFASANGLSNTRSLAVWNATTSTWQALSTTPINALSSVVIDITKSGTNLFLAGTFTNGFGVSNATNILRWDLTTNTAHALGSGLSSGTVTKIAVTGSKVYAGGEFQFDGTDGNINYVALWDGSAWQPPYTGDGPDAPVRALSISGTQVYLGGDFATIDGNTDLYTARLTDTALPVNLVSFTGKAFGDEVHLFWQTSLESNAQSFDIQRSVDAREYITLQSVPAQGTSTTLNSYTFLDKTPAEGINYYRLVQRDLDGKTTTYRTIGLSVDFFRPAVMIYPNPSDGQPIFLRTNALTIQSARLFSETGTELDVDYRHDRLVPRQPLLPGLYLLKLQLADNSQRSLKLLVR